MKTICTAIIKGGCGKSTTVTALAQAAAADGKKVLVIDLDAQGNTTFFLNADPEQPGSYHVLHGIDPLQAIQTTQQGIDVMAGSSDLAAEKTKPGSAKRLQEALKPLKRRYDVCFIDTPPGMSEVLFNALQAATNILVPLESDTSSLQGLYQVVDLVEQIRASNPKVKITGTVLTRYDARPKINRYLKDVIAEKGKEVKAPLIATIRPGVAIREAQALQVSLYQYAPKSKPAEDYMQLWERIK